MNKVVVTGIGTVNPAGKNADEFDNSLRSGKCAITSIKGQNEDDPIKVWALADCFVPEEHFSKKELRRMDRFTQLAVTAAEEALADSSSDFDDIRPNRRGVVTGVGFGGMPYTESEYLSFLSKGHRSVSASYVPAMVPNMAAANISMRTGFKGANFNIASACASSAHAIGEAFRKIKDGYLDVCICGGSESTMTDFTLAGFGNMKALTKCSDPKRASIPFDKERSGFVLGEGAGMLVLEEYEHARSRGAHIYAEICGYGASADAFHVTLPEPSGEAICEAIGTALDEAKAAPQDVDYINAHGTSTYFNDITESAAINKYFGANAKNIYVNSTKSIIGHLLGGAGAVEACAVLLQMNGGYIHPTCGTEELDEKCGLNVVTGHAIEKQINTALSFSLGFGGQNGVLCFRKCI